MSIYVCVVIYIYMSMSIYVCVVIYMSMSIYVYIDIYMTLFEQNYNCDKLKMAALGRNM